LLLDPAFEESRIVFLEGSFHCPDCISIRIDDPMGIRLRTQNAFRRSDSEVTFMKSDGPLILAVLFLASGLTVIFEYGVGTAAFNAAYPFSAANLQMSIATSGPAAIGGLALTALGILVLIWAVLCALVGEVSGIVSDRPERMERRRLAQQERLERAERKGMEEQQRQLKREERLRVTHLGL
jgi:signal transduction histidine kinase